MSYHNSVSVIIPTRSRPEILTRALHSVFSQTHSVLETIVVVDGPDDSTVSVVKTLKNSSLRLIVLPEQQGQNAARNVGVEHSKGDWIAFLDDDDEWLPHKLARQIAATTGCQSENVVVSSKVILRTPGGDFVKPERAPVPMERIDEYLFCRRSFATTESLLQTSTLCVRRQLVAAIPFRNSQVRWAETDWLLRVSALSNARLEFVSEPLSIWYTDDPKRATATNTPAAQFLSAWARSNRRLFSRRAYSGALASISRISAAEGKKATIPSHLVEAFRNGQPDLIQLCLFLGYLCVPSPFQLGLRTSLLRREK